MGGFGKVYHASLQTDGRTVAVKFLRKAFWTNEEARESFLREIESASRISHPGVANYLGWGQSPHGGPYVVSRWIEGQTLEQLGHISASQFIGLLHQICVAFKQFTMPG